MLFQVLGPEKKREYTTKNALLLSNSHCWIREDLKKSGNARYFPLKIFRKKNPHAWWVTSASPLSPFLPDRHNVTIAQATIKNPTTTPPLIHPQTTADLLPHYESMTQKTRLFFQKSLFYARKWMFVAAFAARITPGRVLTLYYREKEKRGRESLLSAKIPFLWDKVCCVGEGWQN